MIRDDTLPKSGKLTTDSSGRTLIFDGTQWIEMATGCGLDSLSPEELREQYPDLQAKYRDYQTMLEEYRLIAILGETDE